MRSTVDAEVMQSIDVPNGRLRKVGALLGYRAEAWRQRLVTLTLIFSDIVLALLVWAMAYLFQSTWGQGPLSQISIASILPNMVVWVGLRTLLGLYPGYGLGQAEELRRQTYASLSTLAITAGFAFTFQIGDAISR